MTDKLRILFLCTGNACRSQMAKAWTRHLKGGIIQPFSAGIMAAGLSGKTVRVMAEAGLDISAARSKDYTEFAGQSFDWLVALCPNAWRSLPELPGVSRRVLVPFDDPPALKYTAATPEEVLDIYRRVRDEIRVFVESLPEGLAGLG